MFTIIGTKMKIIQGDTAVFDLSLDNYKLVSGDTVYFTVKEELQSEEYRLQKVVTDFEDGVARIFLGTTDTNLPPGDYIYDIQCSLADGRVDTVVKPSVFKVLGGVTNE